MVAKFHMVAVAALAAAACGAPGGDASAQNAPGAATSVETRAPNAPTYKPAFANQTRAPGVKSQTQFDVVTVADNLEWSWALEFLPNGDMLTTQKAGGMTIIRKDGSRVPVAGLPPVDARSQGGMLDVALDPMFATNGLIYWSYSEPLASGDNHTAVARGRLQTDGSPRVENVQVIYRQAPSMRSTQHYGSRLVWARDGTLYVTQGERSIMAGRMQAQDLSSLLGKIARINADGTIPADNPFVGQEGKRPEIFSYGNRNVQGATLHPETGELWEVEHGARGGDELNVIRKRRDYGWPTITYGIEYGGQPIGEGITAKPGMEQPVYYWDPVIAPGGRTFYPGPVAEWKGNLFIGGMITKNLVRLVLDGEKVVGEERLLGELDARIRDVKMGPDGLLYILTDRAPGKIVKIVPKA